MSAGASWNCAIRTGGAAACWGTLNTHSTTDALTPPSAKFVAISVGGGTDGYAFDCACGIETDGSVACWGDCAEHPPVQGRITQLSVGAGHACGLDLAGTEWCWGSAFREPL